MFKSDTYSNFSLDLRDEVDWKIATIREVEILADISSFAVEPVNGLVAIGTQKGRISVFGSPAATKVFTIPGCKPVKFLQFSALLLRLLCVDDKGTLHIWELAELAPPRRLHTEDFKEPIHCLTVSPYHAHAFLSLQSGRIVAFDVLALCISPYDMKDAAQVVKKISRTTSVSNDSDFSIAIDIVVHPRNLSLLFIVYSGGIVLYDISQHTVVRAYVRTSKLDVKNVTPSELLQPSVSAFAIHTSGQIFIVGHYDGSFAFWLTDDADEPIDIQFVEKVRSTSSSTIDNPGTVTSKSSTREPIYKIVWSCFGSYSKPWGRSVITVLGGQAINHKNAVAAILLDAMEFKKPSTPIDDQIIHPEIRATVQRALRSQNSYIYSTPGLPLDFIHAQGNSPSGIDTIDHSSILILSERMDGSRTIEHLEFPPPSLTPEPESRQASHATRSDYAPSHDDIEDEELSNMLESLNFSRPPREYPLPSSLLVGEHAMRDGNMVRLEAGVYESILNGCPTKANNLGTGGVAWVDYRDEIQSRDVRWTKQQSHRLLVSHHLDLTVRFLDISPQLLVGSPLEPLRTAFPATLEWLTIRLSMLLWEDCIIKHKRSIKPKDVEVQAVQLTSESKECLIILRSGHVFVYQFSEHDRPGGTFKGLDDEVIVLKHIDAKANTFQPLLMLNNACGRVSAFDLSNIGFLAVGYSSGTLLMVDLRSASVILQDTPGRRRKQHFSLNSRREETADSVQCLQWFICVAEHDPVLRVRLVATCANGATRIYAMMQKNNVWSVDDKRTTTTDAVEQPLPGSSSFVLDGRTAIACSTTKASLAKTVDTVTSQRSAKEEWSCIWVSVGRKGCKCVVNFTGHRVAKLEWGRDYNVECVKVVARKGGIVLLAVMESRDILVYSLPQLIPLHHFTLTKQPSTVISIDDTGDYVDWSFDEHLGIVTKMTLGTFFAIRRVFDEPVVDYASRRRQAPAIPQSIPLGPATMFGSLFNFAKTISGDEVDSLLAGVGRPLEGGKTTSEIVNGHWKERLQNRAAEITSEATSASNAMYGDLVSGLQERGEKLGDLDERFKSFSDGAHRMAANARRVAAEQGAKTWFGFGRGSGST